MEKNAFNIITFLLFIIGTIGIAGSWTLWYLSTWYYQYYITTNYTLLGTITIWDLTWIFLDHSPLICSLGILFFFGHPESELSALIHFCCIVLSFSIDLCKIILKWHQYNTCGSHWVCYVGSSSPTSPSVYFSWTIWFAIGSMIFTAINFAANVLVRTIKKKRQYERIFPE